MLLYILFVITFLIQCFSTVYSINDSDYYRMPPLNGLDDYYPCLADAGAQYCLVKVALHSEKPSELMQMIQIYSNHKRHFNRSEIYRGVCVNRSCQRFIDNSSSGVKQALSTILEVCVNETLWKGYQLQGKLKDVEYCIQEGQDINKKISVGDIVMVVIYFIIIMANSLATIYDIFIKDKDDAGNNYLLAFSLRRNMARLMSHSEDQRLSMFHGVKTLIMFGAILGHMLWILDNSFIANPSYIEQMFLSSIGQMIQNGVIFIHFFFMCSAFLLAYSFLQMTETEPVSWWLWPKLMLFRLFRLAPAYLLIFGSVVTWADRLREGPLWPRLVSREVALCRAGWWKHALFINNYAANQECMPHTWYLAADTQLFAVGLALCIVLRSRRAQKITFALLIMLGLLMSAAITYWEDLDARFFNTPEALRLVTLMSSRTFRLVYTPGHTNIGSYVFGLAAGFFVYHAQRDGRDFHLLKKHNWAYLTVLALVFLSVVFSVDLLSVDGPRPPLYARTLLAALQKPMLLACVFVFIVGTFFRVENMVRPLVEWAGWRLFGRVILGAYLVHLPLLKLYVGGQIVPVHLTTFGILMSFIALVVVSYGTATIICLTVEAPVGQLLKSVMAPKSSHLGNNMAAATAAPEKEVGV